MGGDGRGWASFSPSPDVQKITWKATDSFYFVDVYSQLQDTYKIRVDNVTARTADVYYTTTNSDVYLYDVVPAAEIEGMTDEQAMTHIISNWGGYINYALTSGDHLYEAEYLEPGTDYVAVGFGYDVLTYTTALTKVAFHTDDPGRPFRDGQPTVKAHEKWLMFLMGSQPESCPCASVGPLMKRSTRRL